MQETYVLVNCIILGSAPEGGLSILPAEVSRVTDLRGRVGARVKQLRQARRLTQEQLAERAGLSYKFIGEVERGRGNPTLTTLAALSEALGVGLVDLLGIDPDRPRLSPRQVTQVREALESLETLVEWATPPDQGPKSRKR
jgi:XRE family aerobic/anaerobic benzoate catabolism transcriptional regulator